MQPTLSQSTDGKRLEISQTHNPLPGVVRFSAQAHASVLLLNRLEEAYAVFQAGHQTPRPSPPKTPLRSQPTRAQRYSTTPFIIAAGLLI